MNILFEFLRTQATSEATDWCDWLVVHINAEGFPSFCCEAVKQKHRVLLRFQGKFLGFDSSASEIPILLFVADVSDLYIRKLN